MDPITDAVHLHELQLQQITWGEYRQATRQCAAEITASGGKVVYLDESTGAAHG